MAILEILEYPDPRLRNIAKPVKEVDDSIRKLVDDMFETMYAAPGIGLAATQVNVHKQVIVIDVSEEKDSKLVLINPKITILEGDSAAYEEGCLSVPDYFDEVKRPVNIEVEALDYDGKPFTLKPDGLLAVCIQHEVDHLNGKLFVDYLSSLKRQRVRKKLEKRHREAVRN
jgi:peptide deformylase